MTDDPEVPPQPRPDADTEGFWQATSRGELAVCRCADCRTWIHPPLEVCPRCAGATVFEVVSGAGTVFSFIVANRASVPGFRDLVPFAIATIELDEQPGLRVVSRVAGIDAHDIAIGRRVQAEVVDLPGWPYRIAVFGAVPSSGDPTNPIPDSTG